MKHNSWTLAGTSPLTIPFSYPSMQLRVLLFVALPLAMFFLGTVSAEAAIHYVRSGASGSANGNDWTNAYTTLPSTLTRGDTYYIADGSYGGYTFDDGTSGTLVTTVKKATLADHGTDTGWDSTYGDGQATFSSQIEFTTSYWVFDGVTGGGAENNWNQNFGFKITETNDSDSVIRVAYTGTANNITISHVEMQGKGSVSSQGGYFSNDGLAVYNASNVTISYFWIHGIGRCPFFISSQNFIAEHGWVQSYYGSSAVHSALASIWSFDGTVGNTTFRYNLITDIESTGGLMWDNSDNHNAQLAVYGNVFYRIPGAPWDNCCNGLVGGWAGGNGEDFYNARIYNNTFINVSGSTVFTNFIIRSGDNIANNNLFYNTTATIDYSNIQTHNYSHYIASGGTRGEANGTSATSGDPFVDYVNYNFSLRSTTAAGETLPSPFNTDMFGNVRGADGVWDRGAFEFVNSATRPAAPANLRIQ